MRKVLSAYFILFAIVLSANAQQKNTTTQQKSCCSMPSPTARFAAFASNASFVNSHDAPLPIDYSGKGKMITFLTPDGKTGSAYFVASSTKSNKYLFVFQEYWGLVDWIKKMSDWYADSIKNINVIAVDLYDGKMSNDPGEAAKLMQSMNEDRERAIIKGAISYVGPDAKIATVGWCFGGGWSMQGALMAGKQEIGCVMFYGMPESDVTKLKTLNSGVLFLWANKDQWINKDVKDQFVKNMQAAGKTLTVKEYDADHAFANPSNPHYNQPAAQDAQKQALAYLRNTFK